MYKIKSSLISAEKSYVTGKPIEKPVKEMLAMYDRGEDLTNSPFIQAGQWKHHVYCHSKGNSIESAYERQNQIIELYESIKRNGYNGSRLCVWWDNEGFIHLGDGFHRISILHYLDLDVEVNCETDWTDLYDGQHHRDFPLVDVLLKEAPQGKWTYQPVNDPRLEGWKVDRYDAPQRLEYILSKIKGKKVLDVGCSEGYYARELAKRGYEVTAIDRSSGLISAARYLTILEGLEVDYHTVKDWSEFNGTYDTILFLAVIHNDMKVIGIDKGLEKLKLLKDRANVVFMEVPNNHNERGWGKNGYPDYNFHLPESVKAIEANMGMNLTDKFNGRRVIYTLEKDWWDIKTWLAGRRNHCKPIFDTITTKPCRNIMEIGVNKGLTAFVAIKNSIVPENEINYYGFDLFEDINDSDREREGLTCSSANPSSMQKVKDFLETTKAQIHLYKGNTNEILKDIIPTLPKMDLIHIDGGHSIDTMRNDWNCASQLMHKDTIVYVDGCNDELKSFGSYFLLNELPIEYQAEVMPEVDYYYPNEIGRGKNQLLKIQKYDIRDARWPLFETLKTNKCKKIMEIGTHNGKNAVDMIKASNATHYYGFDLFEDRTESQTAEEYSPVEIPTVKGVEEFIRANTTAEVTLVKGNTRETLPDSTLPKMDLIYIDGGHSIETTRSDWLNAQRFIHDKTIVYFDDYNDEMPFIGSYFITKELTPDYKFEVLPQTNYYKRPYGRLKCQLLRVTKPGKRHTRKTDRFRFHLLGLPHSKTVKDWGPCAFTQLVYRFSQMMTDMGHEVIHYGTEGSDLTCTEHVNVLTEEVQKQAYGDWSPYKQLWIHNGKDLAYTTFRKNAIEEINKRKEPGDMLLVTNGHWLKEVWDKTGVMAVEPFVGYLGCCTKKRVFPSYAWMHHIYGLQSRQNMSENFVTGNWYDAVIPHFFDPSDHTFEDKKEDYFVYFGRLIQRKGIHIAVDITKRIGAKLIVAGQPLWPDKLEESLKHVGCLQPHVEYRGVLTMPEIDKLVSKARGSFLPSLYMEPFGLVVIESLLSGTPVITTDWGSFPEIVPQGRVGYRCRTADDFIWACNNIDKIDLKECRDYAVSNFSMKRIGESYQEYFTKVHDLFGKGWYAQHERDNLDWLRRG